MYGKKERKLPKLHNYVHKSNKVLDSVLNWANLGLEYAYGRISMNSWKLFVSICSQVLSHLRLARSSISTISSPTLNHLSLEDKKTPGHASTD